MSYTEITQISLITPVRMGFKFVKSVPTREVFPMLTGIMVQPGVNIAVSHSPKVAKRHINVEFSFNIVAIPFVYKESKMMYIHVWLKCTFM